MATCCRFVQFYSFCRLVFSGKKKKPAPVPKSIWSIITLLAKASKSFSANSGENGIGSVYLPEPSQTTIVCTVLGSLGHVLQRWEARSNGRMEAFPGSRELPSVWLWTVSTDVGKLPKGRDPEGTRLGVQHSLMLHNSLLVLLMFVPLLEGTILQKGLRSLQLRYLFNCH